MLLTKFSEISENTKFIYKYRRYIKIQEHTINIQSCCNFTRKSIVNAKCEDGQYIYFSPDEIVIMRS